MQRQVALQLLVALAITQLWPAIIEAQQYRRTYAYRPVSRSASPQQRTRHSSFATAMARSSYPGDSIRSNEYRTASYGHSRNQSSRHPLSRDYQLAGGDLLAVIVDGVLGDFSSAPIHMPSSYGQDITPAMGYPVPVRDDGTVNLPLIDPINVHGLTARQAEVRIERTYRQAKVLERKHMVSVALLRKRTISVTVMHDEPIPASAMASPYFGFSTPRKLVSNVTLPADQADQLTALGKAGAAFDTHRQIVSTDAQGRRLRGSNPSITNGAVIEARSAPVDFFYTGGFLPANRLPIPRSGLTVAQAVAMSGGSIGQSPFGASDLYIVRAARQRQPAARRVDMLGTGSNQRIMPGDVLILRQKPRELLTGILLGAARRAISLRP